VVIEDVRQVQLHPDTPSTEEAAFLASVAVSRLPARDLFALYDGLLQRMAGLEAARITGAFAPPESAERASALREGLGAHARLQRDLAILRAKANKEKQLNRRVDLNMEIKRLEAKSATTEETLSPGGTH
jgi:hypothetical protein